MNKDLTFEVGQKYENRKGPYEVIMIDGDSMTILWDNGEEIITSITMQQQIIEAMNRKYSSIEEYSDLVKLRSVKQYIREPAKDDIDEE